MPPGGRLRGREPSSTVWRSDLEAALLDLQATGPPRWRDRPGREEDLLVQAGAVGADEHEPGQHGDEELTGPDVVGQRRR